MGFWGSLWESAKQTGGEALTKLDQKVGEVRDNLEQYNVPGENDLEKLVRESLGEGVELGPEQLEALRRLAKRQAP